MILSSCILHTYVCNIDRYYDYLWFWPMLRLGDRWHKGVHDHQKLYVPWVNAEWYHKSFTFRSGTAFCQSLEIVCCIQNKALDFTCLINYTSFFDHLCGLFLCAYRTVVCFFIDSIYLRNEGIYYLWFFLLAGLPGRPADWLNGHFLCKIKI